MSRSEIKGVLLDLSGTLYSGGKRIDGTRRTLGWLGDRGMDFRFLTNTTTKSRSGIFQKLGDLGIEASEESILTPLVAVREQLKNDGSRTIFPLLKEEVLSELADFEFSDCSPDAVVVGDLGEDFGYEILNRAFRCLHNGAKFYVLARNRIYESGGELFLDMGPFVGALEYALRREAVCLGKPSGAFFDLALAALGLPRSEVAVVGDDLESDVLGAIDYGMRGILVKTGKFSADLLRNSERKPDAVIESIAALPEALTAV